MEINLSKLKYNLPIIEKEITSFLASIQSDYHDLVLDDEFKQDILEGSTDYITIIDRLLFNLILSEETSESLKRARARLHEREQRTTKRTEIIRGLIRRMMQIADLRKISAPNGTVSIGIKPQGVEIVDEGLIPDEFMRIKREPNKTLIGEKLKSGDNVPGTRLTNGGETLIIR
jgi:hypothetical protein